MPLVVGGSPIQIGREIAKGAEGAVHELPAMPGYVAKIYHSTPDQTRARKLIAMAAMPPGVRPAGAAWPVAVVEHGPRVVGFVMPRFERRRELHAFCAPAERKKTFPEADYKFLVAVAANLARAFATVHAAGAVIGDVNERLALVDQRATVGLVDCDSYQIEVDGDVLTCDVGVEQYQPPELQGVTLRGRTRIRNHDCFGLAALVFQLLFFNRHPFAGVPLHGAPPSLGEAIAQHRFAWSAEAAARGVRQPPNTLPFTVVDSRLRELFERAFGPQGSSGGRHKARAWVRALDSYAAQLVSCRANPQHAHLPGPCPICVIEGSAGALLFVPRPGASTPALPDFLALAALLRAQLKKRPLPPAPATPPSERDHARRVTGKALPPGVVQPGFFGRIITAVGMKENLWAKELARRDAAVENAKAAYATALADWQATRSRNAIATVIGALDTQCDRLANLRREADAALAASAGRARSAALRTFLEAFPIASAAIEGIGRSRIAALEGAGIDTAADVSSRALEAVPGFGRVLRKRVLNWRRACEAQFTAPTPMGASPLVAPALASIRAKGSSLEAAIRAGLTDLDQMIAAEAARLSGVRAELDRLARDLAQVRADRAIMA
jgi:DNA-binding helix-hairpin-helix protein with protein kinase domain